MPLVGAGGGRIVQGTAVHLVTGIQAYDRWTVDALDHALREETPCLGLWLDSSRLSVDETVEEILRRSQESLIS